MNWNVTPPLGPRNPVWTDEETARLRELVSAPYGWSAGRIAADLGRSRNAVIGYAKRRGIALSTRHAAAPAPVARVRRGPMAAARRTGR